MESVAGQHRLLPVRAQAHRHMARRMARRRLEPDLVVQREIRVHQPRLPGLDDRRDALRPGGGAGGLHIGLVDRGHQVGGVREGRNPAPVEQLRVPAHMVAVQMGAEHVVHALGRHAGRRHPRQPGAVGAHVPAGDRGIGLVAAHAGVDHDGALRGLQHIGLDGEDDHAGLGVDQPAQVVAHFGDGAGRGLGVLGPGVLGRAEGGEDLDDADHLHISDAEHRRQQRIGGHVRAPLRVRGRRGRRPGFRVAARAARFARRLSPG